MPNPNELYPLPGLEDRLRHSKPKTEPLPLAFKQQLRATLLENAASPETPPAPRFKQSAIVVATVAALLLLAIGLTPAGRVIAEALLKFGPFILTDAPSAAEQAITATPDAVQAVRTETAALTEATEQAGFTAFYPRYLPVDYRPPGPPMVELVYSQRGEVSSIQLMLFSRNDRQTLYYTQTPYTPDPDRPPFELGVGQAEATPVMVGDSEGVWLEDFNWGADANKTPVAYNVLIWELTLPTGETFLFWLGSEERLPLDEMLQIAASMAPAEAGPANDLNLTFGDDLTLLGFDLTEDELRLFWQASPAFETELMAFVHWRDAAGMIAAQVDRPYSPQQWPSGQIIIETYKLRQPGLPPGRYSLVVGLYRPDTGQRLTAPGQPKAEVRLAEIEINE